MDIVAPCLFAALACAGLTPVVAFAQEKAEGAEVSRWDPASDDGSGACEAVSADDPDADTACAVNLPPTASEAGDGIVDGVADAVSGGSGTWVALRGTDYLVREAGQLADPSRPQWFGVDVLLSPAPPQAPGTAPYRSAVLSVEGDCAARTTEVVQATTLAGLMGEGAVVQPIAPVERFALPDEAARALLGTACAQADEGPQAEEAGDAPSAGR